MGLYTAQMRCGVLRTRHCHQRTAILRYQGSSLQARRAVVRNAYPSAVLGLLPAHLPHEVARRGLEALNPPPVSISTSIIQGDAVCQWFASLHVCIHASTSPCYTHHPQPLHTVAHRVAILKRLVLRPCVCGTPTVSPCLPNHAGYTAARMHACTPHPLPRTTPQRRRTQRCHRVADQLHCAIHRTRGADLQPHRRVVPDSARSASAPTGIGDGSAMLPCCDGVGVML